MFLRLSHTTSYQYSQPVTFAPHALFLRPRETSRQRLHEFRLDITPAPRRLFTTDAEDNSLDWAWFPQDAPSTYLEFRTHLLVETLDSNPFDFFLKPSALSFPFAYDDVERRVLGPCLAPPVGTDPGLLQQWLSLYLASPPSDTVQYLSALNSAVRQFLSYVQRDEPGIQTPAQTLELRRGSCRDYAVFFIALCRHLGLASRFVSGYLHEPPPPGTLNAILPTTHAWAEVYLPGGGWRGLDATRGIFCDDAYVAVAHSSVAESVNPIQGGFFSPTPALSSFSIQLTIERL
jgi:transglutaminase-like putative cysteine protease